MSDTLSPGFPHSFRVLTVRGIYRRLSLALLIPVGFAVFQGGAAAFLVVFAALAGAVLADLLVTQAFSGTAFGLSDFRAVYLGLSVAALLSRDTRPVIAAAAAALTVIVGVWLFGGPGRYRVHPALVGPALLGITFPGVQTMREGASALAVNVPSELLNQLERTLLEPIGMRVTEEAWQILFGLSGPDGGALVLGMVAPILLGSLILFGEDLLPAILPGFFLLTYALLVWICEALPGDWGGGNPLDAVLLTNAPFVMLFLVADPAVRPATLTGMALFGGLAGGLAALFWITAVVAAPVVTALFLAGIFVALLDSLTTRRL